MVNKRIFIPVAIISSIISFLLICYKCDAFTKQPRITPQVRASNPRVIFMRHSRRYDDHSDLVGSTKWTDKATRPYDPPIVDFILPAEQAMAMQRGIQHLNIQKIVSSPFRRCVQTAAVVAKCLHITDIEIDDRIRETQNDLRRCLNGTKYCPLPLPEIQAIFSEVSGFSVGSFNLRWPAQTVITDEKRMYETFVDEYKIKLATETNDILIVSHGMVLNEMYKLTSGLDRDISTSECGWFTFDGSSVILSDLTELW